jgi:hypothetical protein
MTKENIDRLVSLQMRLSAEEAEYKKKIGPILKEIREIETACDHRFPDCTSARSNVMLVDKLNRHEFCHICHDIV